MKSSIRLSIALALQLSAATAFVACGGDSGSDGDDDQPSGETGGLEIVFNPMYSAYEPDHTYQLPAVVKDLPAGVTWAASPADAVSIVTNEQGAALITMRKAGEVTLTATVGKQKGTAKLTIRQSSPEEWQTGNLRYNSMNSAIARTDGGTFGGFAVDPNASCTNCHGDTGALEVQHSPQQTGGYSDEQLIKIFSEATKPEGVGMHTNFPETVWKTIHKWKIEESDRLAIVTYLRSLPPKSTKAEIDFGGAIRRAIPDGGFRFGDGGLTFPRRDAGGTQTNTPREDAGSAITVNDLDAGT